MYLLYELYFELNFDFSETSIQFEISLLDEDVSFGINKKYLIE